MHPCLLIVDDCVPCPEQARERLLSQEFIFHRPEAGSAYSYKETVPPPDLLEAVVDRVGDLLGSTVVAEYSDSKVVVDNRRDEQISRKNTWIHYDPYRWTGVLYLNLPEQCRGGTGFYRHRKTGLTKAFFRGDRFAPPRAGRSAC
jgi:hypothetical protein